MSKIILGLDMGHTSIGWALVDGESQQVIDAGVRIFKIGVEDYGKGEKETSLAAGRRASRSARRNTARRVQRLKKLRNLLKLKNLWPTDVAEQHTFATADPYELRAKALDLPLDRLELGRVLYHLGHQRGFKATVGIKSEGKALFKGLKDAALSTATEPVYATLGIDATLEEWQKVGSRTYGEYLSTLAKETRKRARYTLRSWYLDELKMILAKQAELQNEGTGLLSTAESALNAPYMAAIEDAIHYQRPLRDQSDKIGQCSIYADEKRGPLSHPIMQAKIVWEQINNLKIFKPENAREHYELDDNQRAALFAKLMESESIEAEKLSNLVGLTGKGSDGYKTNYDSQKRLKGSKFGAFVAKATKHIKNLKWSVDELGELYDRLSTQAEEDFIKQAEATKWKGIDADTAKELLDYPEVKGYAGISVRAAKEMIGDLRAGKKAYEPINERRGAEQMSDPHPNKMKLLPKIIDNQKHPDYDHSLTNPVVRRAMHQLRLVVNTIMHHYGKPDRVHIEMGRDLAASKEKREQMNSYRKENEQRNIAAKAEAFEEHQGLDLSTKSKREKYMLWQEQGECCLYSGNPIPVSLLFDTNRVQVDHILPLSRTRINSPTNKAVVFTEENAAKGDRTPVEWLADDPAKFNRMLQLAADKGISEYKLKNLQRENLQELDAFISQNLNDTRFIATYARKYLSYVFPWGMIQGSKGSYTADLRNRWFPNQTDAATGKKIFFLENKYLAEIDLAEEELAKGGKNRLDHRHHALDAIVIALTNNERMRTLKRNRTIDGVRQVDLPWPNLVAQVKQVLSTIIISFQVQSKSNGQMHNDTYYGKITVPNKTLSAAPRGTETYVVRKPLRGLSNKMIANIVDTEVQHRVIAAIRTMSGKADWKPSEPIPAAAAVAGKLKISEVPHKNGLPIRKVRVAFNENAKAIRNYRQKPDGSPDPVYVLPENNHHIDIYVGENGKKFGKITKLINLRDKQHAQAAENEEFVCRLEADELWLRNPDLLGDVDLNNKKDYAPLRDEVFRLQKFTEEETGSKAITFKHQYMSKLRLKLAGGIDDLEKTGRLINTPNTLHGIKLKVDPAGFITKVG